MKKKTKIAVGIVVGIGLVGISGTHIYQQFTRDIQTYDILEPIEEKKTEDVKVKINTEQIDIPEYREVTDAETGEKVMAEVQVNEPIEKKSTTPPEKPKAEGSYTNPEQPPTYKEEQTVIEEKPKTNVTPNSNKNQASSEKVYIDGFGYVEKAGETRTQTGVSNGDINKMVGSMD